MTTQIQIMQGRKNRKKLRMQRLEILNQINVFERQFALAKSGEERKAIKKSIQELGQKLQKLVLNPVEDPNEMFLNEETYIMLKLRGYTDKQVAEAVGQSKGQIDTWKRENGIKKETWKDLLNDSV